MKTKEMTIIVCEIFYDPFDNVANNNDKYVLKANRDPFKIHDSSFPFVFALNPIFLPFIHLPTHSLVLKRFA